MPPLQFHNFTPEGVAAELGRRELQSQEYERRQALLQEIDDLVRAFVEGNHCIQGPVIYGLSYSFSPIVPVADPETGIPLPLRVVCMQREDMYSYLHLEVASDNSTEVSAEEHAAHVRCQHYEYCTPQTLVHINVRMKGVSLLDNREGSMHERNVYRPEIQDEKSLALIAYALRTIINATHYELQE